MATRELKAAALAIAAAVSSATNHNTIACEAVAAVVVAVATDSDILGRNVPRKPNGRYLRTHLPTPGNSFWREVLAHGDEMAFFNFTTLLRGSFVDLVELCKDDLLSMPIRGHTGDTTHHSPRRCHQRRRLFTPADIISMTLKFLTTTAELKDLHPQFGSLKTTYNDCVRLGMQVIVKNLINDERAKVVWPINTPGYLESCAENISAKNAITSKQMHVNNVVSCCVMYVRMHKYMHVNKYVNMHKYMHVNVQYICKHMHVNNIVICCVMFCNVKLDTSKFRLVKEQFLASFPFRYQSNPFALPIS